MSKKRKHRTNPHSARAPVVVMPEPLHLVCVRALDQGCGIALTCDYCWKRVFG